MQQKQTHKQYGLITGLSMVVLGLILYVLDLSFKPWAVYIVYVPFLVGLIMNATAFSKANNGYVKYGQVFGSCFKAVAIVTLIGILWALLATYIFPEMKEKTIEVTRENMIKQGQSDEQIEMIIKSTREYYRVMAVAGALFMYMFAGLVLSLIASAVPQKKGEMPPGMQAE